MSLLEECVAYFRQYPVYRKLFAEMRQKYISLSRIGGTVQLSGISALERDQLTGFLGFLKSGKKGEIRIPVAQFCKALEDSRFSQISLRELLEVYFDEPLETRQNKMEAKQNQWDSFFQEVQKEMMPECWQWLQKCLSEREKGYLLIQRKYAVDTEELRAALFGLNQAVMHLPVKSSEKKKLPVFAAEVTGNPHYFDTGTFPGKLFELYLQEKFSETVEQEVPDCFMAAEKSWSLYYQAGILRDDLWNYVLTYGLRGQMPDGTEHRGLSGFSEQREPIHISLLTLGGLAGVYARERLVYVVENPSVFSALTEEFPDKISAICTNGQLRLASVVLLDMLQRNGFQFLYGGDFDPEGLGIADRLKQRYGDSLYLWNYKEEYYQKAISKVELTDSRMTQLEGLKRKELFEIRECLRRERRAGYQEKIIENYLQDIYDRNSEQLLMT